MEKLFDNSGHTFFSIFSKTKAKDQGQCDPEAVCDTPQPNMYPHTKFCVPTSHNIRILLGFDLSRTVASGQCHRDQKTVGGTPWLIDVSTYL